MVDVTHTVAVGFQWLCAIISVVSIFFYGYKVYRKQCGWEVLYIAALETVKIILEIAWEHSNPNELLLCMDEDYPCNEDHPNLVRAPWLRFAEWLVTCPVILIALANLSGMHTTYNFRTMTLLSSEQGVIVFGITSAFSTGGLKAAMFTLGCIYFVNTMKHSAEIYRETYDEVPPHLRSLVVQLAWMFYVSWVAFPILFLAGPEGANHLSYDGSVLGHVIADLLAKNLWGLWVVRLRASLRQYNKDEYNKKAEQDNKLQAATGIAPLLTQPSSFTGAGAMEMMMQPPSPMGSPAPIKTFPGSKMLVCSNGIAPHMLDPLISAASSTGATADTIAGAFDDINAQLQGSTMQGMPFDVVVVKDGSLTAAQVNHLAGQYRTTVVGYGPDTPIPATQGLGAYLAEPRLGAQWNGVQHLAIVLESAMARRLNGLNAAPMNSAAAAPSGAVPAAPAAAQISPQAAPLAPAEAGGNDADEMREVNALLQQLGKLQQR